MRIICFADLHIGQKSYCKIDPVSGLHYREINAINILNKIVDDAIEKKIDVVVFAGDMFKNNLPSPTLINHVSEAFFRLSKNKIHTLILDGNHDVSKIKTFTSGLNQFSALEIPYITQTRFYKEKLLTINDETFRFVFLPTHHTKEEIETLMNNLKTDCKNIIIGHLTIKDAKLNDWNVINNSDCIDLSVFNDKNIHSVILGHLHKYQILNEDPFVFYCGSSDRIDFSEEKQDKGYVLLDTSNATHEFVKVDIAQKYKTINIDCRDESSSKNIENKITSLLSENNLKGTIVRIKLKLDNEIKINEKYIVSFAYEQGIQHLLKIQYDMTDSQVNTVELSNSLSTNKAIETYYSGQTRSNERIKLCKDIVEKVDSYE